jgi:hypothetical protein
MLLQKGSVSCDLKQKTAAKRNSLLCQKKKVLTVVILQYMIVLTVSLQA